MRFWVFIGACAFATSLCAQQAVDIRKPGFGKRAFSVTGFGGDASVAGQVAGVLKNDLTVSGYFSITPVEQAEFVQQGNVRVERGVDYVDCVVTLRANNSVILSKTYQ